MRHGIMHMKHVQPLIAANFGHAHRERQGVVGIFEQTVIVNHDAMEMKSRSIRTQPKRPLVANEMHFVSPARQILPQRGRQNAAAANGRIAGDADAKCVVRNHVKSHAPPRPSPESEVKTRGSAGNSAVAYSIAAPIRRAAPG